MDIEILMSLLQLTKERKITWNQIGDASFEASISSDTVSINYRYVPRSDDDSPERDAVEVRMGRVCETYYNGTEGMRLVRDILSAASPTWREHSDLVARRLAEFMTVIHGLSFE